MICGEVLSNFNVVILLYRFFDFFPLAFSIHSSPIYLAQYAHWAHKNTLCILSLISVDLLCIYSYILSLQLLYVYVKISKQSPILWSHLFLLICVSCRVSFWAACAWFHQWSRKKTHSWGQIIRGTLILQNNFSILFTPGTFLYKSSLYRQE